MHGLAKPRLRGRRRACVGRKPGSRGLPRGARSRSAASPEDRKPRPPPVAGLRIPPKSRARQCAHRSAGVLDNPVGLGDLAQRIAVMAFLGPRSACRCACASPSIREASSSARRSMAAWSCWSCPSPAVAEERLSTASSVFILRISEATSSSTLGRNNHPTLELKPTSLSRKITTPKSIKRQMWHFRTHPALGSYEGQNKAPNAL